MPAEFTGERYVSSEGGIIRAEHYHRYLFARKLCDGKDVLDVASGEGYGAALLGQVAASVVGVEAENAVVELAREAYGSPTVSFRRGLAQALPLPDASVDVVVSFETLEHFAEQDEFLAECRRVLRSDGTLVISTPDRITYSPPGAAPNPFHVKELDREEFAKLLMRHFPHVQMITQTPVVGSLIVGGEENASAREFYDEGDDRHALSLSAVPRRSMYLIAVAGGNSISDFTSLLNIYPSAEADRAGYAEEMHRLSEALVGYPAALAERDATITRIYPFESETVRLTEEVQLRDAEIVRLSAEFAASAATQRALEARLHQAAADAVELPISRLREQNLSTAFSEALTVRWSLEARVRDLGGEAERLKLELVRERTLATAAAIDAQTLSAEKEEARRAEALTERWSLEARVRDLGGEAERLKLELVRERTLATAAAIDAQTLSAEKEEARRAEERALRTLNATRAEVGALHTRASEADQLRLLLAGARAEVDALSRNEVKQAESNQLNEINALEIARASLEIARLRSDLDATRQSASEYVDGSARQLQAVRMTQHEILTSTTWKLARVMAEMGRIAPAPLRRGARAGLRAAARAVRSRAAPDVSDEGDKVSAVAAGLADECGDAAGLAADADAPVIAPTAVVKLDTSAYRASIELERFDLIVICDEKDSLDTSLLLDLEALAASDVRVVLTGRRPPVVGLCHTVPTKDADQTSHLDRLIRACTASNVIVAWGLRQFDVGALHRFGRIFVERPSIAAACGMVLAHDGTVLAAGAELDGGCLRPLAGGLSPDAYDIASVTSTPQLWPMLVGLDADLYATLGGLEAGLSWPSAVARFSIAAERRGFTVACNPLVKGVALRASGSLDVSAPFMPPVSPRRPPPQVLFTDLMAPTPDKDSGSQDITWFMRIFVEWGWRVTFLPTADFRHAGMYSDDLRQFGILCPLAPSYSTPWEFIRDKGNKFDLAIVHRVNSACYVLDPLREFAPQAKVVFDTVDLHHVREMRSAMALGSDKAMQKAALTEKVERDLMRRADATLLLSRYEYDLVGQIEPDVERYLFPIVRDVLGRARGVERRQGALFVGGFSHWPNVDAVLHLCHDLWPEVRKLRPEARLTIVGSNPPPEVLMLDNVDHGVHVLGYVTDLTSLYNEARINLAPLRIGAGMKGKVVAGLSVGLPTLGSSVALEGMGLEEGKEVLLADLAGDFAQQFASLDTDDALWSRISDAGLDAAVREFSVEAASARLIQILNRFGLPTAVEVA